MHFLKIYGHLPGYLHRWRLFGVGRFMARIHKIMDIDRTPFLHSHPFSYVSIILWRGYDERVLMPDGSLKTVRRRFGNIVYRSASTFHRIDAVDKGCLTLFLTWKVAGQDQNWSLRRHPEVESPSGYVNSPDGMYAEPDGYRKREGGFWFAKRGCMDEANNCTRLSIHQNICGLLSVS